MCFVFMFGSLFATFFLKKTAEEISDTTVTPKQTGGREKLLDSGFLDLRKTMMLLKSSTEICSCTLKGGFMVILPL